MRSLKEIADAIRALLVKGEPREYVSPFGDVTNAELWYLATEVLATINKYASYHQADTEKSTRSRLVTIRLTNGMPHVVFDPAKMSLIRRCYEHPETRSVFFWGKSSTVIFSPLQDVLAALEGDTEES